MEFKSYIKLRLTMVAIYTILSIILLLTKEFQTGLIAALGALYMYLSSLRVLRQEK